MDPAVNEFLLWQNRFKDSITFIDVLSVQIFSFDHLFRRHLGTIKSLKHWEFIENLQPVVSTFLNRIVAKVHNR